MWGGEVCVWVGEVDKQIIMYDGGMGLHIQTDSLDGEWRGVFFFCLFFWGGGADKQAIIFFFRGGGGADKQIM